jgi:hypothetical protein
LVHAATLLLAERILTLEAVGGTVTIYDIYGRLVNTSHANILNISEAAAGIYFVRVLDEQGRVYAHKLIKE